MRLKKHIMGTVTRLTSECHLSADVDENEKRHEVDVTQAHHLLVLAVASVCSVLLCGRHQPYCSKAFCKEMYEHATKNAS